MMTAHFINTTSASASDDSLGIDGRVQAEMPPGKLTPLKYYGFPTSPNQENII